MSIKEIKDKILQDALEEKNRILQDTEVKIQNIKNQAIKENELIEKDILDKFNQEADLKEKKIVTEARLNAKKDILSEKQSIINDIFNEAVNRIVKFDDKKYLSLIESLIMDNVETGDEIIYIGQQERHSINQGFINKINDKLKSTGKKGDLKLSNKRLSITGGIILGSGEINKNASFEVILDKIKDEIDTKLNNYLFAKFED